MSFQIIQIPILPMGMVNAYLVVSSQGCILVDAGLPNSETAVAKILKKQGLSFDDINLIIVTHAHIDHAGNANLLRELSKAPILAHQGDLSHFRGEAPMSFCPTSLFGRFFLKTGAPKNPYIPFEPDILLTNDEPFSLQTYGIPGAIKASPGHTAGSISVMLDNKETLVGDLIASGILLGGIMRTDHARRPVFEDDPQQVALELQRLLDAGMKTFYMGHGGPLTAAKVQRHIYHLRAVALNNFSPATG